MQQTTQETSLLRRTCSLQDRRIAGRGGASQPPTIRRAAPWNRKIVMSLKILESICTKPACIFSIHPGCGVQKQLLQGPLVWKEQCGIIMEKQGKPMSNHCNTIHHQFDWTYPRPFDSEALCPVLRGETSTRGGAPKPGSTNPCLWRFGMTRLLQEDPESLEFFQVGQTGILQSDPASQHPKIFSQTSLLCISCELLGEFLELSSKNETFKCRHVRSWRHNLAEGLFATKAFFRESFLVKKSSSHLAERCLRKHHLSKLLLQNYLMHSQTKGTLPSQEKKT